MNTSITDLYKEGGKLVHTFNIILKESKYTELSKFLDIQTIQDSEQILSIYPRMIEIKNEEMQIKLTIARTAKKQKRESLNNKVSRKTTKRKKPAQSSSEIKEEVSEMQADSRANPSRQCRRGRMSSAP